MINRKAAGRPAVFIVEKENLCYTHLQYTTEKEKIASAVESSHFCKEGVMACIM